MLILTNHDVSNILLNLSSEQVRQLLNSLGETLSVYSKEQLSDDPKCLHQPHRSSIVTKHNDTTLVMPSSDTTSTGVKIVTLPHNGSATGAILVIEPTGQVMGMLNAAEVTAFRTALTIMTLFVRVTHIRKENIIRNITIFNRGRSRLDQLEKDAISSLRTRYPQVNFRLVSREATPDFDTLVQLSLSLADVVFCCTPSTEPLCPFRDLASTSKPRFISAIGSYKPHMHEIDTETLLSGGQIFVDSKDACLQESGELITANVKPDQLAEIGQFLASDDSPGIPSTGNIIFKCVGMGIMDLVISRGLLDIADKAAIGQTMAKF
ncbi:hypothetical protein N7530_010373 [Penicillium desertorum]|uniref:Ornithine cyclodeaminase/mu-crystallin family protein n=1 Tax=Penicillium desertorum TaxID=1303715 RepID=A0A9W9WHV2_9EURO|nr:hypothetical protein N7530_010373 [Penicillium desertorum]